VGGFVVGDFFEIVVEVFVEAGFLEVREREVCKAFAVELVLCITVSEIV